MKTPQILERKFYEFTIRQNHKDEFFNLTDMLKVGNVYRKSTGLPRARIDKYLSMRATQEFIKELSKQEDKLKLHYSTGRGTKKEYWGHKLLFLDFTMWLNPEFKIKVFNWLMDNLTVFRDSSGESYKQMAHIIQDKYGVAKTGILITETARKIKNVLKVTDWNKASENQLKYRDKIHNNITLLLEAGVDIEKATALSLQKAVKDNYKEKQLKNK